MTDWFEFLTTPHPHVSSFVCIDDDDNENNNDQQKKANTIDDTDSSPIIQPLPLDFFSDHQDPPSRDDRGLRIYDELTAQDAATLRVIGDNLQKLPTHHRPRCLELDLTLDELPAAHAEDILTCLHHIWQLSQDSLYMLSLGARGKEAPTFVPDRFMISSQAGFIHLTRLQLLSVQLETENTLHRALQAQTTISHLTISCVTTRERPACSIFERPPALQCLQSYPHLTTLVLQDEFEMAATGASGDCYKPLFTALQNTPSRLQTLECRGAWLGQGIREGHCQTLLPPVLAKQSQLTTLVLDLHISLPGTSVLAPLLAAAPGLRQLHLEMTQNHEARDLADFFAALLVETTQICPHLQTLLLTKSHHQPNGKHWWTACPDSSIARMQQALHHNTTLTDIGGPPLLNPRNHNQQDNNNRQECQDNDNNNNKTRWHWAILARNKMLKETKRRYHDKFQTPNLAVLPHLLAKLGHGGTKKREEDHQHDKNVDDNTHNRDNNNNNNPNANPNDDFTLPGMNDATPLFALIQNKACEMFPTMGPHSMLVHGKKRQRRDDA